MPFLTVIFALLSFFAGFFVLLGFFVGATVGLAVGFALGLAVGCVLVPGAGFALVPGAGVALGLAIGSAFAVTVTLHLAERFVPSAVVNVISASPAATAVTRPASLTFATASFEDFHVPC